MSDFQRPLLIPPNGQKKALLHSCCAPCSGEVMEALSASGIEYTVFFYNPNIHPAEEYRIRKDENIAFAKKLHVPFVDADYDTENWFARAKGLEREPERGKRCAVCFDVRFERTALYAYENNFPVIASSLAISRWKDMNQVNACGMKAASYYPGIVYWDYNWRKEGGSARSSAISKREQFYTQEYCGCVYSLRDSNAWRISKGKQPITFGGKLHDVSE